MVVTYVDAETNAEVWITGDSGDPVNLSYKIDATGAGLVKAGMNAYVADGHGADTLDSRWTYKEKPIADGDFVFNKKIVYTSNPP